MYYNSKKSEREISFLLTKKKKKKIHEFYHHRNYMNDQKSKNLPLNFEKSANFRLVYYFILPHKFLIDSH